MSVYDKSFTWAITLIVAMPVVAEIIWEFPAKSFVVDLSNNMLVMVSKDVVWPDPQNATDIGPAGHVAAVDKYDVVLVRLQ